MYKYLVVLFWLGNIRILYPQEEKEIYFLNRAKDAFLNQNLDIARNFLIQAVQTNTEIQNNKEYLKLQFFLHFINSNYYISNQYFQILEQSNYLDDFLIYFRILFLIHLKQYEEIPKFLEKLKLSSFYSKEEFSILPFDCNPSKKNDFNTQLQNLNYQSLWRDRITQREKEFINFLKEILIHKNDEQIPKIEDCIEKTKTTENQYHLYRFLLWIQPTKENYFLFYHFLYRNQNFLEALHVLRTIHFIEPLSINDPDFYFLILNFKNLYEKLNYQKNVDVLLIFVKALLNGNNLMELRKIATQNYYCRELLLFLMNTSDEPQKTFFREKLQEYDANFDLKEKITLFKKIYKYY